MFTNGNRGYKTLILVLAVMLVTSCNAYKKVSVEKIGVSSIENVNISSKSVSADIAIAVDFINASSSKFSLKEGNVRFYKGKDNLFAELMTGQSPVLSPKSSEPVTFACKAVCYKPTTLLIAGISSLANVITDDMFVEIDAVVSQGSISKKVKIKDLSVAQLIQMVKMNNELTR